MHHNCYKEDPYAKEFGISIDDTPTSIEARVLPAPWVRTLFTILSLTLDQVI